MPTRQLKSNSVPRRIRRRLKSIFGASAAAVLLATAATAQTLPQPTGGRIVTFGDSLSDNGNLFALSGFPAPPYFAGRFSNGQTWTEILSGGSQGQTFVTGVTTGNVNLAFGGARTDTVVASPPGVPVQIGGFLLSGGTFGRNDTVTMLAGANNIFQYFTAAGAGATPAGITTTATGAAN
ncbi:MAG: hypothetical protein RL291_1385, partial [Pseudomonadota bacterium]